MKEHNKSGKNAPEQNVKEATKNDAEPIEREVIQTNEEYNADLKLRLEEETKSELINYDELKGIAPDFAKWLKEIVRYGNVNSQVLIYKSIDPHFDFRCNFYTNDHVYSIVGYKPKIDNEKGYLGCTASTRKSRVGEDWNRGNDLPDGPYSKKTFDSVVRRIVAYELKSLQLWRSK